MTDLTTPGEVNGTIDNVAAGNAWDNGVGSWIVDGAHLAPKYSSLDETVLNAFELNTTSGSLDVTFDPGEAYVGGWLCRDTQTTVTLSADSKTRIYVGYDASAVLSSGQAPADSENIIVGPEGDFATEDPRTLLYVINTTTDQVSSYIDRRVLQKPIDLIEGDVSVSVDMSVSGRLDTSGREVISEKKVWDGTSLVLQNEYGDTIEFIKDS